MILQYMHFDGDVCPSKGLTEELYELFNEQFCIEINSAVHMNSLKCFTHLMHEFVPHRQVIDVVALFEH